MIILTGASGFIGSCLLKTLNEAGMHDIILVDDFSNSEKQKNIEHKKFSKQINRNEFLKWFLSTEIKIDFVLHIGAKTDTTLFDKNIFDELNLFYSQELWKICSQKNIPLIYASSAATYGGGEFGYDDDESKIKNLQPLNPYGQSKQDFDVWALQQNQRPPFWAGLKFFNVYGPNEYHKARMASVVFHAFHQIKNSGKVKLFKSHKPEFQDGEQLRDFIYVKDICKVILFLMNKKTKSGIYNLGTGKARSFNDLVNSIFKTLQLPSKIEYIETPIDIRDKYQYFTEANMQKLIAQGYDKPFTSIEDGVKDYVKNYLEKKIYF
jgi:ADP-L-glycero-D-manno-heptose 6-epimerase